MRPDAKDIFIDVYRRGGVPFPHGKMKNDPNYWDEVRESIRRPHRRNEKSQSDFVGHMVGFMRKNVGRPWDKVYSEVKAHCDYRTIRSLHFLEHLKDMVEEHPVIIGKVAYYPCNSWRNSTYRSNDNPTGLRPIWSYGSNYPHFYVDQHGLLCLAPVPKHLIKQPKPVVRDRVTIGKEEEYRLVDGCWFHFRYEVVEIKPRRLRFQFPGGGYSEPLKEWKGQRKLSYRTPDMKMHTSRDAAEAHLVATGVRLRRFSDIHLIENPVAWRIVVEKRQLSAKDVKRLKLPAPT